ncbi:MAG: hypothetical protein KTR25_09465 [Myxococcales bacterium]|nr:hypothetical protein [Myxococcales bacterium]
MNEARVVGLTTVIAVWGLGLSFGCAPLKECIVEAEQTQESEREARLARCGVVDSLLSDEARSEDGRGGRPVDTEIPGAGDGEIPSAGDGEIPPLGEEETLPPDDISPPHEGTPPTAPDNPVYYDPGTGPWDMASPKECKMDISKIIEKGNIAVFRYGKLCFIQGGNTKEANYSVTKTLGGVLAGRAAYLVAAVPRTGPGTGPILHEDQAVDWLGAVGYNDEALLSHVMSMTAFNKDLLFGSKHFSYDTFGTREINDIVDVAMVAVQQLGGGVPTNAQRFMEEQVFAKLGMSSSSWNGRTIGTGWIGSLEDMGRMGVMLVHDGWWNGERFMESSWVYRMSHPAHEDANPAYGQLAWLNHRGNATGIGGDISRGPNAELGDPCAPPAFWPEYPHVGSEALDCRSEVGDQSCSQTYDVGVFSAQGFGGQLVVMHPGLDLVMVAHDFSGRDGPMGLWNMVRPAVVAADPVFEDDEAAFCEAYGAGDYAPDLPGLRLLPTE